LFPPSVHQEFDDLKASRLPFTCQCNIHPWMRAYVGVFDHPYFAVTDSDGRFTMPAPPAGRCVLKIWHESKGWIGGAAGRNGRPTDVTDESQEFGMYAY
jgi:hypothetical protein